MDPWPYILECADITEVRTREGEGEGEGEGGKVLLPDWAVSKDVGIFASVDEMLAAHYNLLYTYLVYLPECYEGDVVRGNLTFNVPTQASGGQAQVFLHANYMPRYITRMTLQFDSSAEVVGGTVVEGGLCSPVLINGTEMPWSVSFEQDGTTCTVVLSSPSPESNLSSLKYASFGPLIQLTFADVSRTDTLIQSPSVLEDPLYTGGQSFELNTVFSEPDFQWEGEVAEGEVPEGEVAEGEVAEGEVPEGEVPEGEVPEGEVPEGEVPEGEVPEGEVAEGEVAEGEVAEGEVAEGEVAEGEVAEGEVPEGEVAEGEVAEGEVAEGEVAEGEVPEGEGQSATDKTIGCSGSTPASQNLRGDIFTILSLALWLGLSSKRRRATSVNARKS